MTYSLCDLHKTQTEFVFLPHNFRIVASVHLIISDMQMCSGIDSSARSHSQMEHIHSYITPISFT